LRRSIIHVVAALAALCAAARADTPDLGDIFKEPQSWSTKATDFQGEYRRLGFRFMDGQQTAMSNQRELLRFLGLEVCEARVYFGPEAVRRVELSLYNKGDAGVKDRETFEALAETVKAKICEFLQDSGMTGKTSNERANYFARRHQWIKRAPGVQLEWACVEPHRSDGKSVPYSAEFIKVLLVPLKAGGGLTADPGSLEAAARTKQAQRSIRENVTRNPAGDVWIDGVPMVDQGQKGYCAAAASERVLRYYGIEVDQHQIAQLADTAAEGGTTLEGMSKAISKVGRQFQLDKEELIPPDTGGSFGKSAHAKLLEDYNAVARKMKEPQIDWQMYTANEAVDIQQIWQAMKPDILLTARVGEKQAMSQFVKNVTLYVDQGVPLLWSCLAGMYPETPTLGQDGAFGHVRLIVGYNTKTKEVLYSDSWGPGHALKRLPLDQAWAMSKGLIVLRPRGIR
jgi:hypothetical protein